MALGYFLHIGDKTTCGGVVIEGYSGWTTNGFARAREGDAVTCGEDGEVYRIAGGVTYCLLEDRRSAGSLDSISTCPCSAHIIPSQHGHAYGYSGEPPAQPRAAVLQAAPLDDRWGDYILESSAPSPADFSGLGGLSRPATDCVFAKSCVSVPVGSTDAGTGVEPATYFGATAVLAPAGAAGNLGRVAGAVGADLGSWTLRGVAGASTALSVMLLALWPRDIGDATLYSPEQLRQMESARTRVRFQFRRDTAGAMQVYGLHTKPGRGEDRVSVVHAHWNASYTAMVATLGGITITWTPNDGPVVSAPSPYPGATQALDNILVHPIPPGEDSRIAHYPGREASNLTWQDTIITFPLDSGLPPLYLVFSKPGYHRPPVSLAAFPDAEHVRSKSQVRGGGHNRTRWKDRAGRIYEWDYQHGTVEVYSKQGIHLGEYDSVSGEQTKPAKPGRRVEK